MADLTKTFQGRASDAFDRQSREMNADVDKMLAEHSAKGRLQSGATIIAALDIYEKHSAVALDSVLAEAAKIIEHRGRKWKAAMYGVELALSDHLAGADEWMTKPRKIADSRMSPSISRAIEERLEGIRIRLGRRLSDFRDGWTAPVPKQWKDRHPFLYAVSLLVIGAIVGLAVRSL